MVRPNPEGKVRDERFDENRKSENKMLTQEEKEKLKRLALKDLPSEVCGLAVEKGGDWPIELLKVCHENMICLYLRELYRKGLDAEEVVKKGLAVARERGYQDIDIAKGLISGVRGEGSEIRKWTRVITEIENGAFASEIWCHLSENIDLKDISARTLCPMVEGMLDGGLDPRTVNNKGNRVGREILMARKSSRAGMGSPASERIELTENEKELLKRILSLGNGLEDLDFVNVVGPEEEFKGMGLDDMFGALKEKRILSECRIPEKRMASKKI